MNPIIAPSLLSADFAHLAGEVMALERAGADWLHFDIMDGHFVPNISFGTGVIKNLRPLTKKFFDVHLMIEQSDDYLESFIKAGSDQITIHVEASHKKNTPPDISTTEEVLKKIKLANKKSGIAISPKTPLDAIIKLAPLLDIIIVMSVEPGFGGQSFIMSSLEKITQASALVKDKKIMVEVDGGVTADTSGMIIESFEKGGAELSQLSLVAGNYIMGDGNQESYGTRITALKRGK